MDNKRRQILKLSGLTVFGFSPDLKLDGSVSLKPIPMNDVNLEDSKLSIIGKYGDWITQLKDKQLPKFSFRNSKFTDLKAWQKVAKTEQLTELLFLKLEDY